MGVLSILPYSHLEVSLAEEGFSVHAVLRKQKEILRNLDPGEGVHNLQFELLILGMKILEVQWI